MSNPTELPGLDKLEALARAATPGPWDVNQAAAMQGGRLVVDELYVYSPEMRNVAIAADIADPVTGEMSKANADFIAAANPAAVLTLIALARRPPVPAQRPTDDELWDSTIRDRDTYHEWADKLADAIASYFGVDIGEHSNQNCPWHEALEAIESAAPARRAQPEGEAPQAWNDRPTTEQCVTQSQAALVRLRDQHAESGADWTGVEKRGVFLGQHGAPGGWHMKAGRHDGVATLLLGHHGYVELNGKFNVELTAERCKVMHEAAQSQGAQALTADDLWEIQGALRAHGKVALSRKVADAASRAQQAAAPGAQKWTAMEIADACVKAGLGILECHGLIVTLKGGAAGTPEAPSNDDLLGTVARAIWNIRREEEDRCDMELEDMGDDHPVWAEAEAVIAAIQRAAQLDGGQEGSAT